MKLKVFLLLVSALLIGNVQSLQVLAQPHTDLLQVYYEALNNDPIFKKAAMDWESAKQELPIARAGYLTQIHLMSNAQRQYHHASLQISTFNNNGYNYDYGFVLNVSQPIFNLPVWNGIQSAKASVKSATAHYLSAGQDLIRRTVKAYVAVLQAYDQLRFQKAKKRAVYEQLKVAREQFKVGLIPMTGIYEARSVYDQAVAESIANQNALNDAIERLAEITGKHYLYLCGIERSIPLIVPQPTDINAWVNIAVRQNYGLQADTYDIIAARRILKQASTRWAPTLSLSGTYTNDTQTALHTSGIVVPALVTNNVVYGLTLDFPMVQGGLVSAETRQARYRYLSVSSQRERVYRSVISQTRQSFFGVITGISKIKADRQSVISAVNALKASKIGYKVGTRTMVNVLDDVTSLYQKQQQYADDQYQYIIDTIDLKYNAGTLDADDLKAISQWFHRSIKLPLLTGANQLSSFKSKRSVLKTYSWPLSGFKQKKQGIAFKKKRKLSSHKKKQLSMSANKLSLQPRIPSPRETH